MGEQNRDSDSPQEASPFNPFVRSHVEYEPSTRLRMAEDMASSRKLTISPLLKSLINDPENYYHQCQQSTQMVDNAEHRRFVSYNTKREAQVQLKRAQGLALPARIPMIEINPTRVTLSLEFESQYYPLMTNDYGDHENVASIMKETNTLIQLPDSFPDGIPPDPFVQQVTITGHYSDVDKARKLMRDNCHVSVYMSTSGMRISLSDLQTLIKQHPIPNVELKFVQTYLEENGRAVFHVRFTSRVKRLAGLVKIAEEIARQAFESIPDDLFLIHFTLSSFHAEHVIGVPTTKLLMPEIESRMHTKITYRKFNSRDDIKTNLIDIKISGGVRNVIDARKCIIDLLPISICVNMKNTDMAASTVGDGDRNVFLVLEELKTQLKLTASIFEPAELLRDEEPLNCASLRSKEFNIRNVYKAYQQLFNKKLGVIAPEPHDYDESFWHKELDCSFFSFQMPCRGEAPDSGLHMRRQRTTSVTSAHLKPRKGRQPSDEDQRSYSRTPSTSESPAVQFVMQPQYMTYAGHQIMTYPMDMMKAPQFPPTTVFVQHPMQYYNPLGPQMIRPEYCHMLPPEAFVSYGVPVAEVDPRADATTQQRLQQAQRKHTSRVGRTVPMAPSISSTPRHPRRDDEPRSNSARSRRTSTTGGDEQFFVGSYEERGNRHHYQQQHHQQPLRFSRDETLRLKSANRADAYVKTLPLHRTADQDFQTTHHLQLRNADIDLEHERLFTTHDSPRQEHEFEPEHNMECMQRLFSSASIHSPYGRRSRAASCSVDKEEPTSRYTDSDCAYSVTDHPLSHHSKSIENFRKNVTKTMLEPRSRDTRTINKVNLEIRGKPEFPEEHPGSVRITIDQLMASVQQTARVVGNIKERKWQDVLEDKQKEQAAAALKESEEATVVAVESFEDSPMDYAFRNEEQAENLC